MARHEQYGHLFIDLLLDNHIGARKAKYRSLAEAKLTSFLFASACPLPSRAFDETSPALQRNHLRRPHRANILRRIAATSWLAIETGINLG
jgi:hypothetical protein